ncbi:MAG: TolC family protein [Gammaproteobacteria bacterium]|nr:TolC family protein [Gammaproteobacteria bacterium]
MFFIEWQSVAPRVPGPLKTPYIIFPVLCSLLGTFVSVHADEASPSPLPDPLSLEAALNLQSEIHPDVSIKEHALATAKDQLAYIESDIDLDIRAQLQARYIEPPEPLRDLGREDHSAKIVASKTLYDFGRTAYRAESAKQGVSVAELELEKILQQRRIDIMQAFFNVIMSDLQYNYDNEAMAIYYIQYDRAKQREELGQLSEIDVLQRQSEYMEVRRNRYKSEAGQRTSRIRMSEVLDRPAQIVSRFIPPKLPYSEYKIKDVKQLQEQALQNNLDLRVLRLQQKQLQQQLQSLRARRMPVISASAEAGVYSREIGSNDAWRFGLGVEVPLYQGSRVSKSIAIRTEQLQQLNLTLYQQELALKREILSLWLDIDVLLKQKQSSDTGMDYRELYLDKARSLYEMEVKSDLGDSMVALTAAAKYQAETEFEIALKWERLRFLTQMSLEEMRQ